MINNEIKIEIQSEIKQYRKKYYQQWRVTHPEYRQQYYVQNKEKELENGRQWHIQHKKERLEYNKQWRIQNKEKCLKNSERWKNENKEKWVECQREWRSKNPKYFQQWCAKNPEKYKKYKAKADIKRGSTLKGRLNLCMSSNIRQSLKGSKEGRHWESLVGYTVAQLKKHLEKLFKPDMAWENYGSCWSIDHIIPISVFNFDKPEHIDFRLCWSLKNLQPLEIKKNSSKRAKIIKPFQPSLKLEI